MKTKRRFYSKVFFYSLVACLIIFGSSRSFGYEWSKTFGGSSSDWGNSAQQTTDGGYIIVGTTVITGVDDDVYLIKTDSLGNELWTKTFGGGKLDRGKWVQQTTDGGYIIVGETDSFDAGNRKIYLIKTDAYGDEMWSKTFVGELGWQGNPHLAGALDVVTDFNTSPLTYNCSDYTANYDDWLLPNIVELENKRIYNERFSSLKGWCKNEKSIT